MCRRFGDTQTLFDFLKKKYGVERIEPDLIARSRRIREKRNNLSKAGAYLPVTTDPPLDAARRGGEGRRDVGARGR
jgi:hypothetical protein